MGEISNINNQSVKISYEVRFGSRKIVGCDGRSVVGACGGPVVARLKPSHFLCGCAGTARKSP